MLKIVNRSTQESGDLSKYKTGPNDIMLSDLVSTVTDL